ncbi:MAG TPA: hypothetical protein VG365_03900 [Solirubrobacteraceae bacterium]|nr:hypothetical protein [Solirubrobacteraceae bacterium]
MIASIALIAAVGGGSALAATGALNGQKLRNGSVTHSKLATNSIWHGQLGNGVVQPGNLNQTLQQQLATHNAVGPAGPQGTTGAIGPQGATGATGATGREGVSGYQVFSTTQTFGPNGIGGAWCGAPKANTSDQGWVVVGGGVKWDNPTSGSASIGEWPETTATDPKSTNPALAFNPGWNIQANGTGGSATVYAVCLKTS